ncbi:capsular polysaccharide export protein, LipB/KpsS family [Crenobacter luteus]|uniref:capsular polysaccharide export protein, LipB/KpsS family n=1 Tax=Crenobacter luteus TaxID=1452487 RepID=UPI0009ECDF77|nr:hypothetical protein [Crenobacter luteus]
MNILLLSNWAPGYYNFFNAFAKKMEREGHNIVVAVDSEFSREENRLDALGFKVYEFSSFFRASNLNKSLLKKYSKYNLNSALLSDFERAEVYGLWGKKSFEYFERLKSALLAYYEHIFEENKIDVVLYENVSNAFSHFAFFASRENNVRYVGLGMSRLPGRFFVSNDPLADHEQIENIFSMIRAGKIVPDLEVRQWAENYLDNIENIVPDYMRVNNLDKVGLFERYASFKKIGQLIRAFRHIGDDHEYAFQVGNPVLHIFNAVKRNVLRRIKQPLVGKHYQEIKATDKYLLYPLHYHPEASTSILCGAYMDEYEVIRNIAFNLPQGVCLYVKDHMSAFGYPSIDFYRRVAKLPNVKLIVPTAQTKKLIKKSLGVITLTSTVGYEAVLLNKPVFLYGDVFYRVHSNVFIVNNPLRIFDFLEEKLKAWVGVDFQYNVDFVCAYYLATKRGTLNFMLNEVDATELVSDAYFPLKAAIVGE